MDNDRVHHEKRSEPLVQEFEQDNWVEQPDKKQLLELAPELIEAIVQEIRDGHSKEEIISRVTTTSFSGPLPHPDLLAGYEISVPGAADRIIKMAEEEQSHRHLIEKENLAVVVEIEKRKQTRADSGLSFGTLAYFAAIGGAIILSYLGGPSLAIVTLAGVGAAGTITSIVKGGRQDGK